MDAAQRRAWAALALGPIWLHREQDAPVEDAREATALPGPGAAEPAGMAPPAIVAATPLNAVPPTFSPAGQTPHASPAPRPAPRSVQPSGAATAVPVALVDEPSPDQGHSRSDAPGQAAQAVRLSVDRAANACAAGMDWQQLRDAVSACQACALGQSRRQSVFGVGDTQARWLIVGEAPGADEDEQGEPFVGQAGKLLDNMLTAVGLARGREVFIANALKCRPPKNRNPEPGEIACCAPFLARQIALLQPAIILALGRFAAQSLLGSDATIDALRGRIHAYRMAERSIPLVVSYHPGYLLRKPAEKSKSWADLCLARSVVRRTSTAG